MSFSQRLTMKQGQGLVMTPQLTQSIKLLALSNIELAAFVEGEMERNPFLEKDTRTDGQAQEKRESTGQPEQETKLRSLTEMTERNELETGAKSLSENLGASGVENEFPDEQDYRQTTNPAQKGTEEFDTRISSGGLAVSGSQSAYDKTVADFTANQPNLRSHLGDQLAIAGASKEVVFVVNDMIDNLDDAGYLRVALDDLRNRIGCSQEQANEALALLQSFDPVGVWRPEFERMPPTSTAGTRSSGSRNGRDPRKSSPVG